MKSIEQYFEKVQSLIMGIPEVNTFPEHEHIAESVVGAYRPDIEKILLEVEEHFKYRR